MPAYNIFETDSQEEGAIVKAAFDACRFALVTTSSLTGGTGGAPYVLTISGRDLQAAHADYYRGVASGCRAMRQALFTRPQHSREELERVKEIYRRIAARENPKGGFITAFAESVTKADSQNLLRLYPVALELISAYQLEEPKADALPALPGNAEEIKLGLYASPIWKKRGAAHFHVAPRYTSGSPAMVDIATALRVAAEEQAAIRYFEEGTYGEEGKATAGSKGLKGIAEYRVETRNGWLVYDLLTGAEFTRKFGDGRARA